VGEHTVDAVVLDYKMPGMDGAQVAEVLRREHPTIPIVLLTGVALEVPETLLRMVDAYVRKGENAEVLLSAIAQVLSRTRKPSSGTRSSIDERDQDIG
jgi:CheY-like chemotaxis protein